MHSDTPTEAACWRIWYYLNERGACWDDSILASANIDEGLFDDAIDVLMELDVIMESEHNDDLDKSKYVCVEDNPPFFAVFPQVIA